jgi:hypothetical protein
MISHPPHEFHDKVDAIGRTPYEKAIFLDTDTWVAGLLDPVFVSLAGSTMKLPEPGSALCALCARTPKE